MTENGLNPLPLEEEHCTAVEVTEEEVQNSVKLIPTLSAVVSPTLLVVLSSFNHTVPNRLQVSSNSTGRTNTDTQRPKVPPTGHKKHPTVWV